MEEIKYKALTFVGRRENNQDSVIALSIKENVHFLAVADGMGGVAGGQVASNLVLNTAENFLQKIFKEDVKSDQLRNILNKLFLKSQEAITDKIKEKSELTGMGTTLACVLILENNYVVGNLGDSRVYHFKDKKLNQITIDHTYVNEYKKKAGVAADETLIKTYGHILTRSIDGGKDVPDIFPQDKPFFELEPGEAFLICSDGLIIDKGADLTKVFADFIIGTKDLKTSCEYLISNAFQNGSKDNISVVLAEHGKIKRKKVRIKKWTYPPKEKKSRFTKTKSPKNRIDGNFNTVISHQDGFNVSKPKKSKLYRLGFGFLIICILATSGIIFEKTVGFGELINLVKSKSEKENNDTENPSVVDTSLVELNELKRPRIVKWEPFYGQKFFPISISNPERFSWASPNLENDFVSHYDVGIKREGEVEYLLREPELTEPFINFSQYRKTLKPGQYDINIILITEKELRDSVNIKLEFTE